MQINLQFSEREYLRGKASEIRLSEQKTKFLFGISLDLHYLCNRNHINKEIMEAIIDRTPGRVTVSMSTRRWNRMLQLEEAYKLARIIKRSMKQVEAEPSMTPEEAIEHLRAL